MKKVVNSIVELLPDLIGSFEKHSLFDRLEDGDIVSIMPIDSDDAGQELVTKTNTLLANYFEVEDELCYTENSYADAVENPLFFWMDYINCFYNWQLLEDDSDQYPGTKYGLYQITQVIYVQEVNKRLKQRRLNGMRMEYKVQRTPLDQGTHWKRSYDKEV